MIIEYTEKERAHIQKIRDEYRGKLENASPKEREALILSRQTELDAYIDECEKKRFDAIGDNPEAIIANAKEQIPLIIEVSYKELTAHTLSDDLLATKIATSIENGAPLIDCNFMAECVRDELKFHIEVLRKDENQSYLGLLFEYLIDEVKKSAYTDKTAINNSGNELMQAQFKRSPIRDITDYGIMNDRVNIQMLQDAGIFKRVSDGQINLVYDVNQAPRGAEPVPVYVAQTFSLEDGEEDLSESELKASRKITAYDDAVENAIADLYYYWHRDNPDKKTLFITSAEIWRRMNGKQNRDGSAKPGKAQIEKVDKSVMKMRHTDIYMDLSNELKKNYITLDDERLVGGYFRDYMVKCREVGFVTENNRVIKGYAVEAEPIRATYNRAKKHVLFVPFSLLDTSETVNDTEYVTEFKLYLLRQILLMKNKVRNNNKIVINSIYSATGIDTPEQRAEHTRFNSDNARQTYIRKARKSDKEKIEAILTAWINKQWIKDFIPLDKNGKRISKARDAKAPKDNRQTIAYKIVYEPTEKE